MTIKSLLTSILPIIALTFAQNGVLAKKQDKAKLALLVPFAVIYAIAGVFVVWEYHIKIETILQSYGLLTYSVIAGNMLLMSGFIVLKGIVGSILKNRIRSKSFIEATSSSFYTYAEEYDMWFLQFRWSNYRVFQNVIRWGMVLAAGLFLSIIKARGGLTIITLTFPCSVVIIFNEIYHFFNGQTREEFEHNIRGAEADSRRIGNYFRIREILEHILPEPLLSALTGFELAGRTTPADLVNKLSKSEDKFDRITADYFLADNRYMQAEADGVKATLDLMHRKNVVFHDPFYRDLDLYITLPMLHALVSGKKTIVITGRTSAKSDVIAWLSDVVSEYTHMPTLWHVGDLGPRRTDCEVGVLSFAELYDPDVLSNNSGFFEKTEFVILIEPSAILSTGQIALSILAQELEKGENKPVYFVCDRMVDGLVDTMSHLLRSEFTEVVASPVPRCVYTGMGWDANGDYRRQQLFDKQTRYLGNGTELAAIAVKNQIPRATWYGETKLPVRDVKWIVGQNYPVICQYINQPAQQNTIYEKIDFVPNLWCASQKQEQFAIVEDEFNNMFQTMREYISRGKTQSFVNVLSENYLLRDYMRFNQQMFVSNPDAVPSIVPDYAKTERNTLIKLILLMTRRPVGEQEILDEFHLVGCDSDSAYALLNKYLIKYTGANGDILDSDTVEEEVDELTTEAVSVYTISRDNFRTYFSKTLAEAFYIVEEEADSTDFVDARFFSHVTQCVLPGQFVTYDGKYYRVRHISPQTGVVLRRASDLFADRRYYRQLRSYVLEDTGAGLISSRKVSGVEFAFLEKNINVTTSGYLDMNDVHDLKTARAVDLSDDPLVGNYSRSYLSKEVLRVYLPDADEDTRATFCVLLQELFRSLFPDAWPFLAVTMNRTKAFGDVFEEDGGAEDIPEQTVPADDYPAEVYADPEGSWEETAGAYDGSFETEVSDTPEWDLDGFVMDDHDADTFEAEADADADTFEVEADAVEERIIEKHEGTRLGTTIDALIYPVYGDVEDGYIYIIEDSDIDLGMLGAIERNWDRMMEIMSDFLSWHFSKISERPAEEREQPSFDIDDDNRTGENGKGAEAGDGGGKKGRKKEKKAETPAEKAKREWWIVRLIHEIRDLFPTNPKSKGPAVVFDPDEVEVTVEDGEEGGKVKVTAVRIDTIEDVDEEPEVAETVDEEIAAAKEAYSKERPDTEYNRDNFLHFGSDREDGGMRLIDVFTFMAEHGWADNSLTKARKRESFLRSALDVKAVNHCDFCGRGLSGASYEMLNDGRVRCNDCSASAVTSVDEMREIFFQSLDLMEAFYGIKFRIPVTVQMADARTVAKAAGSVFRPSREYAARVLGFARNDKGRYSVVLENGSPRLAALETMVHEMTHIWQYINWPSGIVERAVNMGDPDLNRFASLMVYEGMAVWSSIQYLYQIGETHYAAEIERATESRLDPYGLGFLLYREQYPLVKDASLIKITPFATFPPIDPQRVRELLSALIAAQKEFRDAQKRRESEQRNEGESA